MAWKRLAPWTANLLVTGLIATGLIACGTADRSEEQLPHPPPGGCPAASLGSEWVQVTAHRGINCAAATSLARRFEPVLPSAFAHGVSDGDKRQIRGSW